MISAPRAPAERGNALLERTWKALERVTLDPGESVPLQPPPSSYSISVDPPGEKTSIIGRGTLEGFPWVCSAGSWSASAAWRPYGRVELCDLERDSARGQDHVDHYVGGLVTESVQAACVKPTWPQDDGLSWPHQLAVR
jgi:hypothetical protein